MFQFFILVLYSKGTKVSHLADFSESPFKYFVLKVALKWSKIRKAFCHRDMSVKWNLRQRPGTLYRWDPEPSVSKFYTFSFNIMNTREILESSFSILFVEIKGAEYNEDENTMTSSFLVFTVPNFLKIGYLIIHLLAKDPGFHVQSDFFNFLKPSPLFTQNSKNYVIYTRFAS